MKWLSVGAWLVFSCLPVSAGVSHTHKSAHDKAGQFNSSHHSPSPLRHSSVLNRSLEGTAAKLRTASFGPAAIPQSSTSSTSASSKKKSSKKKHTTRREPTQMAPTPERISEVQSALARGGYYKTDPTGKWGADTVDALQRFQSANGLDVTGKLDALTLQKLGLGSDVAGVSAPKGIVPHSCCSMTPSHSYAPPASTSPATRGSAPPADTAASSDGGASGSSPAATRQNDPH